MRGQRSRLEKEEKDERERERGASPDKHMMQKKKMVPLYVNASETKGEKTRQFLWILRVEGVNMY